MNGKEALVNDKATRGSNQNMRTNSLRSVCLGPVILFYFIFLAVLVVLAALSMNCSILDHCNSFWTVKAVEREDSFTSVLSLEPEVSIFISLSLSLGAFLSTDFYWLCHSAPGKWPHQIWVNSNSNPAGAVIKSAHKKPPPLPPKKAKKNREGKNSFYRIQPVAGFKSYRPLRCRQWCYHRCQHHGPK